MKRVRFQKHWHGWFYDETYRANIDVIWPVDAKQIAAFTKHRYGMEHDEYSPFGAKCVEVTEPNGRQTQLICLAAWRKPDAIDYSFLAHECLHATFNILSQRGMKLENRVSSEAYTFLLESLVRRCLEVMDTRRTPRAVSPRSTFPNSSHNFLVYHPNPDHHIGILPMMTDSHNHFAPPRLTTAGAFSLEAVAQAATSRALRCGDFGHRENPQRTLYFSRLRAIPETFDPHFLRQPSNGAQL